MYIGVKQRKNIPVKSILFFSGIFVVAAVFIIGVVLFLTKGPEFKDRIKELPFTADSTYFAAGSSAVYENGGTLTALDNSLDGAWQVNINSTDLSYITDGNLIAATGGGSLTLIDSKGNVLYTAQTDGIIKSVRLGRDKVAVCADQVLTDRTLTYIILFDLKGNELFKKDITGMYMLDYGFDKQSTQLYILEIDVSGSAPVSRITTFKPETQSTTGIRELKDQLIQKIYIAGDTVYTMGTRRLSVYTSLTADPKEIMIYGWVLEDISTKGDLKFVYIPNSDSDYIDIARVISPSGDESKINLPPGVFKIIDSGDKIYCFASGSIFVYTGEGKYLRTYELPFAIDGASRAMDGYVFFTSEDKAYLSPLP